MMMLVKQQLLRCKLGYL